MRLAVALVLFLSGASTALASEPITNLGVVLLQPSSVMEQRVPDIDAMAEYIRSVEAASRVAVNSSQARQSAGGFIVIAVRPGRESKVWLDFDTLLDLEVRRQVIAKVAVLQPFEVVKGPVVFGLKVALWNGKPPRRALPVPLEWKGITRNGEPLEVGELVESIWSN